MVDNLQRIEELKRELAGNPQSRQFYQLGELLRREGRNAEAAEVLRTGVAVHPKYVAAWVALGRARLEIDRPGEAAEALDSALALDRQNPVAWRLLGEAKLAGADRWGALEAMSKALELVPGDEVLMAAVEALAGQTAPPSEQVPLFSVPRPMVAAQHPGPVPPPAPVIEAPPAPFIEAPSDAFAPVPLAGAEAAGAIAPGEGMVAPAVSSEPEAPSPAAAPFAMPQEAEPLEAAGDWDVFTEPVEKSAELSVAVAGRGDVFAAAPAAAAVFEAVEAEASIEVEPVSGKAAGAEAELPAEAKPAADLALVAESPAQTAFAVVESPAEVPGDTAFIAAEPEAELRVETASCAAESLVSSPAEATFVAPKALVEAPERGELTAEAGAAAAAGVGEGDAGPRTIESVSYDVGGVEAPVWVDVDVSGDPYAAAAASAAVTAGPPQEVPPDLDSGRVSGADAASQPAVPAFQIQPEAASEGFAAVSTEMAESSASQAGLFDAAARPYAPAGEPSAGEESGQAKEQVWLPATITMARLLIQQQQLGSAVEVLERVMAREPQNVEAADLLELVRDMMQPDVTPLPPLSLRSRKIAVLQRWQASITLGRERVAP